MSRKTCVLCDGNIVNGRCSECGMNYSGQRRFRLNDQTPVDRPVDAQVHADTTKCQRKRRSKPTKKKSAKWVKYLILGSILFSVAGEIYEQFTEEHSESEYLEAGLDHEAVTGAVYLSESAMLGEEFPEGAYELRIISGYGIVAVWREEEQTLVYYYESEDVADSGYETLELQRGDLIEIDEDYKSEDFQVEFRPCAADQQ